MQKSQEFEITETNIQSPQDILLGRIKWFATGVSFIGAMNIALNTPYSKYAFFIFLISSSVYMYAGYRAKDWALFYLNVGFFIVDIVGIYRWFI